MRTLMVFMLLGLAAKAMTQVVYAEYFFDDASVPYRQGTPLTVPANTGEVQITATLNVNELAPGFHQAFFRVKDAATGWSSLTPKVFLKRWPLDTISGFKYCIDEQMPGSTWEYTPFSNPQTDLEYTAELDLSNVSKGIHYIRFMACTKNKVWTPATGKTFFSLYHEPVNITAIEYFFEDENENRSSLYKTGNFTPSPHVTLDSVNFGIPVSSLVNLKEYYMYIRAVDETGNKGIFVKDTLVYHAPPVGIKDYFYLSREIIAFPNPAKDLVNLKLVELNKTDHYLLQLVDQGGTVVKEESFTFSNQDYYTIRTSVLAPGVYHAIIYSAKGQPAAHVEFIKE